MHRLVPGLSTAGHRLCTDCGGGLGDYICTRCGREGWRQEIGVCGRCILTEQLWALLEDGSGVIRPELIPFFDSVCAMSRPRSGILWLTKPHVPPNLQALAKGQVPLTHAGLDTLSPVKSVTYLRDLLVACGTLPPVDRFLYLFEQWLPGWLAAIEDDEDRQILSRFATWQVLRGLRTVSARRPIGYSRNQNARVLLRVAAGFLTDLHALGRDLKDCDQADIDAWFAQVSMSHNQAVRAFLRWAITGHHTPNLRLPPYPDTAPKPISQRQHTDLLRRAHSGEGMTRGDQIVAMLILLYGQPLERIVRLSVDDVLQDGQDVFLRLGRPPVPIPPPFDQVLLEHVADRSNLTTATNPHSRLLFPGRRAGQPLHPTSIRLRLQTLKIPNQEARTRAIRELLLQAPASVVADMLGYNPVSAQRIADEAGSTWKSYAAGEHKRNTP